MDEEEEVRMPPEGELRKRRLSDVTARRGRRREDGWAAGRNRVNQGRSLGSGSVGNSTGLVYIVVVLLQNAWKSQRSSKHPKRNDIPKF